MKTFKVTLERTVNVPAKEELQKEIESIFLHFEDFRRAMTSLITAGVAAAAAA